MSNQFDDDEDDLQEEDNLVELETKVRIARAKSELNHYALLEKLKNYLFLYYEPVQDAKDAEFHYTTAEIREHLLNIYPNEFDLSAELVATWLHEGGFTFCDFGEMRLEWILKKA